MGDSLVAYGLLVAGGFAAGYYARSRRGATAPADVERESITAGGDPQQQQRLVDTIVVRCERLDHMPGHAPAAVVERSSLASDVRNLQRLGWAGDGHANLCHYHNPGGSIGLDVLHVLCGTPDCGERTAINGRDVNTGFGRLRNDGWTNVTDHREPRCPYCSGRPRPRW